MAADPSGLGTPGTEDKDDKKMKKLKSLSLVNNVHNLQPSMQSQGGQQDDVAIVNALRSSTLMKNIILRLEGKTYDPTQNDYIHYRDPVMNKKGIGNFITVLSSISETIEFSYVREREIPKLGQYLFKTNYPYFTIYHEEYDLQRSDMNLIASLLMTFILSTLYKAKGAGHRNVIRGVYSEDLLGRFSDAVDSQEQGGKKNKWKFSDLNPFKKSRQI